MGFSAGLGRGRPACAQQVHGWGCAHGVGLDTVDGCSMRKAVWGLGGARVRGPYVSDQFREASSGLRAQGVVYGCARRLDVNLA